MATARKRTTTRQAATVEETAATVVPESLDAGRISADPTVCPFCGSKISRGRCLGCGYIADVDAAEGRV